THAAVLVLSICGGVSRADGLGASAAGAGGEVAGVLADDAGDLVGDGGALLVRAGPHLDGHGGLLPLRPGHDPELAHDVSVRRLPPAALEPSTVELTESPALSVGDPAHGVGDRRGAGAAG